jgi:hypothetical protein
MRRQVPYVIVGNIHEIVENKRKRNEYTYRKDPSGDPYYIVRGRKIPVKEFLAMYPIDVKPVYSKGENCDRKHNWMTGGKSY